MGAGEGGTRCVWPRKGEDSPTEKCGSIDVVASWPVADDKPCVFFSSSRGADSFLRRSLFADEV